VIFSVAVVALALLFTPELHQVPMAVLAAIVMAAVQGLIAPLEFVRVWKVSRVEAVIAVVTFAVTVASAPRLYWGVLTGVVMAWQRRKASRLSTLVGCLHKGGVCPRRSSFLYLKLGSVLDQR